MSLTIWRRLIHKSILMTGALALVAVISGASVDNRLEVPRVIDFSAKWWNQPPSPMIVKRCEDMSRDSSSRYFSVESAENEACTLKTSCILRNTR